MHLNMKDVLAYTEYSAESVDILAQLEVLKHGKITPYLINL